MNQLYGLFRFFDLFLPWLAEAVLYAFVVPTVVGSEPLTATARILVVLVVGIVGSYYDRRLWQARSGSELGDKPSVQAGQVIIPVVFYLFGGWLFGLVVSIEILKLLFAAVMISVTKYLIFELQFMSSK